MTNKLVNMGHEPGRSLDQITDRILDAVRSRLVLLVPGSDDTVMFEVRSLQELMASRVLTIGSDEELVARLAALLPSPHWRNGDSRNPPAFAAGGSLRPAAPPVRHRSLASARVPIEQPSEAPIETKK